MDTDSTGLDPQLLDLLVDHEERVASGSPTSPEELCRACPERVDEVRRLLARVARLDPLFSVSSATTPTTVPGFELITEVGRGGMGVVYQARDVTLDRVVAVKVPKRVGEGMPRTRFEREVRALAKLRHPNIVPVHSAALAGDTPYLVMEFVPGGSLAERAKGVADTPERAAALVAAVARAVAHAHAAGIVHRDLKPSNILIDDRGRPLVTDFGVAALLAGEPVVDRSGEDTPDDRPHAVTRLTRSGGVVGTPAYAAPEVYDPERFGPVGPAADIWALGVILYELLTGRRPFSGGAGLREQVCSVPHPPASGVGRRWRRVIDRCLSKDPAGRFRSADELADALTVSSRRWWWAVAAGVVAIAVAGGFALWPRPQPPVPAAVWPDVPAVRDASDRLARGEAVDLIAPDRPPAAFDWATGVGSGKVVSQPGEEFRVLNQSRVGTLVELLPALPPGRYRIDAELWHESGSGLSWVGAYAAASHCEIPRGRQHFMLMARLADLGWHADPVDLNGARVTANRQTHLTAWYLGDSDRGVLAAQEGFAKRPGRPLSPAPPAGWRKVSLTVDAANVTAAQAGEPVGTMSFDTAEQTLAAARRKYPDLPAEWSVPPFGGVGVYVTSGTVAVRAFRVTPIPADE